MTPMKLNSRIALKKREMSFHQNSDFFFFGYTFRSFSQRINESLCVQRD